LLSEWGGEIENELLLAERFATLSLLVYEQMYCMEGQNSIPQKQAEM
jgi:hypothetical protein